MKLVDWYIRQNKVRYFGTRETSFQSLCSMVKLRGELFILIEIGKSLHSKKDLSEVKMFSVF